jgi:T-complex protein 1 subunit delta
MAVDAVMKIIDPATADNADLRNIRVSRKLGGTIDESELINGLCFVDKKASHLAGGPTRIENAKIGLI